MSLRGASLCALRLQERKRFEMSGHPLPHRLDVCDARIEVVGVASGNPLHTTPYGEPRADWLR